MSMASTRQAPTTETRICSLNASMCTLMRLLEVRSLRLLIILCANHVHVLLSDVLLVRILPHQATLKPVSFHATVGVLLVYLSLPSNCQI
jgi:hypothetical protein